MNTFFRFIKCYSHQNVYYRLEFLMQFIREALMMYCFYALWNALFDQGMGYKGASRLQVVIYGVYGAVVSSFITKDGCQTYIRERVKQGTVDADLVKPIGLQQHMLMRDFAQKLSKFFQFTIPTLLLFQIIARLFYLPSIQNGMLFVLSVVLAYGVLFSINFLFGMVCFYTLSIESISFCYTAVVSFFAGQLVPIWMFPMWAQKIVNYLPFRCIYDIPMSIFIERITGADVINALLLQVIWLIVLWLAGSIAWRGVRSRVISQGG